jgi:hypothetical protein
MSYELDGAFAGRNAGELRQVTQSKTVVQRTPGLEVTTPSEDPEAFDTGTTTAIMDYRGANREIRDQDSPVNLDPAMATPIRDYSPYPDPQMAGLADLSIPGLGKVNVLHLAIGVAVGVAAAYFAGRFLRPKTNPRRRYR